MTRRLLVLLIAAAAGWLLADTARRAQPPAPPVSIPVTIANPGGPFDLVVNTTAEAARIPPGGSVTFQDFRAGDVVEIEIDAVLSDSAPWWYGKRSGGAQADSGVVLFGYSKCVLP